MGPDPSTSPRARSFTAPTAVSGTVRDENEPYARERAPSGGFAHGALDTAHLGDAGSWDILSGGESTPGSLDRPVRSRQGEESREGGIQTAVNKQLSVFAILSHMATVTQTRVTTRSG